MVVGCVVVMGMDGGCVRSSEGHGGAFSECLSVHLSTKSRDGS